MLVMPVSKVFQENKEFQANVVRLALPVPWELLETKVPRENVDYLDQRVPLDPKEALEKWENLESLERRDLMAQLVAQEIRVHQDLMVPQDPLEEMDHLESLDPPDPQVPRVNTENLAHRVLKVFLVL